MKRNRLRSDTYFLSMHNPMSMKDALKNEDWSKAMKEEIDQIEKNKTQIVKVCKKLEKLLETMKKNL